jgi:hypothetical protein
MKNSSRFDVGAGRDNSCRVSQEMTDLSFDAAETDLDEKKRRTAVVRVSPDRPSARVGTRCDIVNYPKI